VFRLITKDDVVKIDDSLKKTAGLTVGNKPAESGKSAEKAGPAATSGTPSVNVQLSSQAQALASQVASASVFDANKVEEIKAAIAGGRFQVDAEKVAEGLMDTVRELIQTQTRKA
jgi:negative regulator of flagellin synthesis FlgM